METKPHKTKKQSKTNKQTNKQNKDKNRDRRKQQTTFVMFNNNGFLFPLII